ncbi:MAG: hypothetical protein HC853_05860 [Anaerolineae bacterium]|nr:hypothetical protein [Anaerolineae bacterium]
MLNPRVLLLIYNPVIESEGSRKLNQVLGWNDPNDLAQQYIADVLEVSHGFVQYQITERIELDRYPVKADGFRYTDDTYLRCWRTRQGFHQPDTADYPTLLRDANFVPKFETGQLDELWMFGFPYAGFYESCMAGQSAIWCNGPVIPGTERISRRFVVMGFSYERGVGEMLEDLGHRAESIMEYVFRDVPDTPVTYPPSAAHRSLWDRLLGKQPVTGTALPAAVDLNGNLWRQFIRHDNTHPGMASCGNVHFAPSSLTDYDWGNHRRVLSNADDWLNYPNFTGAVREMNCADWGHGDIRAHHRWWMTRFPHSDGVTPSGKPNNWWLPIIDPNVIA